MVRLKKLSSLGGLGEMRPPRLELLSTLGLGIDLDHILRLGTVWPAPSHRSDMVELVVAAVDSRFTNVRREFSSVCQTLLNSRVDSP
jgi:hypothetical protein